jgi:hypothetical protein
MAIERMPEPLRSLLYASQRIDEALGTVEVPALAVFGRPLPDAFVDRVSI